MGDDETAYEYARQAVQAAKSHSRFSLAWSLFALGHALAGLGRLAEAAEAYAQALAAWREGGRLHLTPDPLAGLARVALAQGEHERALAHVGEILAHLEDRPALEGTVEPVRVYLTCYRVLCALGDPRAEGVLDAGYELLQERGAMIEDEDLRRSFLENVPHHRELVAEWEETSHP
jgi:tetratricopeptide (TPR) repeat protein